MVHGDCTTGSLRLPQRVQHVILIIHYRQCLQAHKTAAVIELVKQRCCSMWAASLSREA